MKDSVKVGKDEATVCVAGQVTTFGAQPPKKFHSSKAKKVPSISDSENDDYVHCDVDGNGW